MFIKRSVFLIVVFSLQVCFVGNVSADLIIGFSPDGSTNTIPANVGDDLAISVYAIETGANQELSTDGLISMGLRADFNTEFGNVIANATSADFRGGILFQSVDNDAGKLELAGGSTGFANITGNSILLGELTFHVTASGVTTFEFRDFDPLLTASNFTAGNSFADLDPLFFGDDRLTTYSVSIEAVPEPSSIVLALVAAVFGAVLVRRQRYGV